MKTRGHNIAFIGGIHGVGKSTICQHICSNLNFEYFSASELIKWAEINEDPKNKLVQNIPETQNRLIVGLKNIVQKNKNYLLDGHYCLLNSNNEVVKVPLDTFKRINPFSLSLILGDISEIKQRLESRDNKPYDYHLLENLQSEELSYAKYVSKVLGISLNVGMPTDYSELLLFFSKKIMTK